MIRSSETFLPQYSAQAVIDLERIVKRMPDGFRFKHSGHESERFKIFMRAIISMLRAGVHVVMPPNGEVYRSNDTERTIPTADECASFTGLPAPVTCFEYQWTHTKGGLDGSQIAAPKRISIACDAKQIYATGEPPPGFSRSATLMSMVFDEVVKLWIPLDTTFTVLSPLVCEPKGIPKILGYTRPTE